MRKYFNLLAFIFFLASLIYSFHRIIKAFDFVKEIYFYTGIFALIFLNLSLFFSLFKFKQTKDYPKILGFFAIFWSIIHFLNYFIFDRNAQIPRLLNDILYHILETTGFIAFVVLCLMFLSSFKFFKKLCKIRKLGYLCLIIASYHYFLSPKIPMFWEWTALIIAIIYFILRYIKNLRFYFYQNWN
ncbi:ferric reductase-like transmembrane domain-containing protein [Campylobacter estrildidarum]|uniref:Ferric reductase n=1 Tax=Campylobacter estrildidarum TaxID=2510189 RepID=A0A4V6DW92_9BACT|nr:ferric reductase-like transmembrane domain-containing protein [Campylobacter estrildidarum]TKX31312.1 ferric reductase [Campylobacter estrildidarum]